MIITIKPVQKSHHRSIKYMTDCHYVPCLVEYEIYGNNNYTPSPIHTTADDDVHICTYKRSAISKVSAAR